MFVERRDRQDMMKGLRRVGALEVGSSQEVEKYCKDLIKTCAKGGGSILTHGSSWDEARPQNVRAMIDSAKKYGWY